MGANGAGKTTLLRLVAGESSPGAGRVAIHPEGARVVLCPQEVAEPGPDVAALARRHADGDGEARRVAGALRLAPGDLARWRTLSPGERKRWQLAGALASDPEVLLLDEPTNHVDGEGRALLVEALRAFRGAGILVSHDRDLLEALTVRTLRLEGGTTRLFDGPYGLARDAWEAETRAARARRAEAQGEARRASRLLDEARRRREAAERSRSGARRDPRDRDARSMGAKMLRAWAEARLARDVRARRTRVERAEEAVPDASAAAELGRSVFVGWARAPRPVLLALEAGEVRAGPRVVLRDVRAWLGREERVRLAGPNGSGKTTLLRALLSSSSAPPDRILFLPQDLPDGAGARGAGRGARARPGRPRSRALARHRPPGGCARPHPLGWISNPLSHRHSPASSSHASEPTSAPGLRWSDLGASLVGRIPIMKSVVAFVGSARKNGVTYRATRQLLDDLESFGDVRSELVFLSDCDLQLCRGCKACFLRGEEFCPLHDDRNVLIDKMTSSDGLVLASPTYSFQVSAIMKVFLDRLGFVFHRPRFFGKAFTSIVIEGRYGGSDVVKYLDFVGGALGFNVVKGSSVVCRQNPNTALEPMVEEERRKMDDALARQSRRFHERLSRPAFPAPSMFQLLGFRMARTGIKLELGDDSRDHAYYRDHGWFDSDYFYPTRLGPLKRAAGAAFDRMAAHMSKPAARR